MIFRLAALMSEARPRPAVLAARIADIKADEELPKDAPGSCFSADESYKLLLTIRAGGAQQCARTKRSSGCWTFSRLLA